MKQSSLGVLLLHLIHKNYYFSYTLSLEQNDCQFAGNIFKFFFSESISIFIETQLKFVPVSAIDNNSTVVQVMSWCQTGDKWLPEPMSTEIYNTVCHD